MTKASYSRTTGTARATIHRILPNIAGSIIIRRK
jgi:hypothetical protein